MAGLPSASSANPLTVESRSAALVSASGVPMPIRTVEMPVRIVNRVVRRISESDSLVAARTANAASTCASRVRCSSRGRSCESAWNRAVCGSASADDSAVASTIDRRVFAVRMRTSRPWSRNDVALRRSRHPPVLRPRERWHFPVRIPRRHRTMPPQAGLDSWRIFGVPAYRDITCVWK